MPERTSYAEGAPCWVDLFTPDLPGHSGPTVRLVALLVDPHGAGFSIVEPTALPDE